MHGAGVCGLIFGTFQMNCFLVFCHIILMWFLSDLCVGALSVPPLSLSLSLSLSLCLSLSLLLSLSFCVSHTFASFSFFYVLHLLSHPSLPPLSFPLSLSLLGTG